MARWEIKHGKDICFGIGILYCVFLSEICFHTKITFRLQRKSTLVYKHSLGNLEERIDVINL